MVTAAALVVLAGAALAWWMVADPPGAEGAAGPPPHPLGGGAEPNWDLAGGVLGINLVSARDAGCSPDSWTSPDPGVRIFLDDKPVIQAYSDQYGTPRFAMFAPAAPRADSRLTVEAYEAEPDGKEIACDLTPEFGDHAVIPWNGTFRELTLRGTSPRAMEVRIVLGHAPEPVGEVAAEVGIHDARISWRLAQPAPTMTYVVRDHRQPSASVGGTETTAMIRGLCDNADYTFWVVSQIGPWWITAAPVSFKTYNVAPEPPRVLKASARDGLLLLEWEEPTAHDIAYYELHAGPAGFRPDATTKLGIHKPFADWRNQHAQMRTDAHGVVRIVAVDSEGASAASPEFAIGAPEVEGKLHFDDGCPSARR